MNDMAAADIAQTIGGGAVGIFGLGWLARLAFRKIAEEGTATARAAGEADVITVLRDEVTRLAEINSKLSDTVAGLQAEVIGLRRENGALQLKVDRLNEQLGFQGEKH